MNAAVTLLAFVAIDDPGRLVVKPDAFPTLVNPPCSHCIDEAKRRAELKPDDPILAWIRGYSEGGAIPIRFFLNQHRVISDSYGVFVYDPDAGFARGFAPSFEFRFHGWKNGVMLMKHKDGTIYSSLSGRAVDGPRRGEKLQPVPTLTSQWGWWMKSYPDAVAYRMTANFQATELAATENADSVKSRGAVDPRLPADEIVLGVFVDGKAEAHPAKFLNEHGPVESDVAGRMVVLWEPGAKTAAAYRLSAHQPRKFRAPEPDETGVSPPNPGAVIPAGAAVAPSKPVTLELAPSGSPARFQDRETKSFWDVAGRCVSGSLKGYSLEWIDSVQVKWFAWSAEHPQTEIVGNSRTASRKKADAGKQLKAIAGTAEFLRLLPKPFGLLKAIDIQARTISVQLDGERDAKTWRLEPDAEIKVDGWWGRLEQFKPGDRVWVWLKLDRKKKPVSAAMLADEASEFDMHGRFRKEAAAKFSTDDLAQRCERQRDWLKRRWIDEGLPGTLTFHHVFSGEMEVMLDHEAMRWGRSLQPGDVVHLPSTPPIKAVVKAQTPWRERTLVRLVVGELESSELKIGDRVEVKMTPPSREAERNPFPLDVGRPRGKAERIEWFLASTYCTCGVGGDVCTGHFYTLASCNPNGCGLPNSRREELGKWIDQGKTDENILAQLLKEDGGDLLRPHLAP